MKNKLKTGAALYASIVIPAYLIIQLITAAIPSLPDGYTIAAGPEYPPIRTGGK